MIKNRIEVAVGVIKRAGKVLVGQRLVQDCYFHKWEFPGGKLEEGESAIEALARELDEELGVRVISARPLITLEHDYPDRCVRLFVYEINQFSGEPMGAEGQSLQWVSPAGCHELDFLEANTPITQAVQLPSIVFITDISLYGIDRTINTIRLQKKKLDSNFMIQLREPDASEELLNEYLSILRQETDNPFIILNGDVDQAYDLGFDGVQLNRYRANSYVQREDLPSFWIGASCHDVNELKHAEKIADFAFVSPVLKTSSHPEAQGIGWQKFEAMVNAASLPCYALGGLELADMNESWQHGGQGVAAISSVWSGKG